MALTVEAAARAVDQTDDSSSRCRPAPARRVSRNCASCDALRRRRVVFVTRLARALGPDGSNPPSVHSDRSARTISALYGSIGVSGIDEDAIRQRHIVVATAEKSGLCVPERSKSYSTMSVYSCSMRAI